MNIQPPVCNRGARTKQRSKIFTRVLKIRIEFLLYTDSDITCSRLWNCFLENSQQVQLRSLAPTWTFHVKIQTFRKNHIANLIGMLIVILNYWLEKNPEKFWCCKLAKEAVEEGGY